MVEKSPTEKIVGAREKTKEKCIDSRAGMFLSSGRSAVAACTKKSVP